MNSFKRTHCLSHKQVIQLAAIMILLAGTAHPATTTISSFPYTASQVGTNYSETLLVAGTNLPASGSALNIQGHDIVVYLINDTITFGTDGGNNHYGIQFDYSSHHIKIIGGTIYHGGAGDGNVCLQFGGTNDVLIEGTDMRIAGSNGHCVYSPSLGEPGNYNIEASGGNYHSDVTGYTNRCNYDGSALWFGTTYSGYGNYHYKIHGINLVTGPSQGLIVSGRSGGNDALVFVYACTLQSDARNDFYTSGNNTCLSAANPYQICASHIAGGSEIHDNVITSGTNYGGSRGIILEMCNGTPDNYVEVYNNHVDVHEGVNLEESRGLVQVLRMRFGNKYVHVHNNTLIGTGSTTHGSSYGGEVAVFRLTATDEEGHEPDHGIIIERNMFRAVALSSDVDAWAGVFESFPNIGNIYRYNRFESPGEIICFGEMNHGADGIMLFADTFVQLSPSYDPKTVVVGWQNFFSASDDTLRDCVYLSGASEEGIVFGASGSDYRLERTLSLQVMGNNSLPVRQAVVTVVNNYGHTVLSGTTNSNGIVTGAVTYHWEQNTGSDSTDYNDFTVKAKKESDSTVLSFAVTANSTSPALTLTNTPGEEPDIDATPPATIGNLNAIPGTNHGAIDLSWTAPGDDGYTGTANHYVIKYSTNPITGSNWSAAMAVSDPPLPSAAGTTESFTIEDLSEGYTYYVAIETYDEENNVSNLSNVPQAYAAGIVVPTPAGTAIDSMNGSVTLTCDQVASYYTLSYQFALDSIVTFPNPRFKTGSTSGSIAWTTFDQLVGGVNYHWRCRAVASDLSDSSDWSSVQTFSLIHNNPPGLPGHASPSNGDSTTADPIVLVIDNAFDADGDQLSYDFWISVDSLFATALDSVINVTEGLSQTSVTFTGFTSQNGAKYWWRCRAKDGAAFSDKTTPTWFIWVDLSAGDECQTPPSKPTLVSPDDSSAAGTDKPTLCVTNSDPAPGCTEPQIYTFEIYSDSNLATLATQPSAVNEGENITCYSLLTPLLTGRYYWWRARSSNGTSYSEWAGSYSFNTPNTLPSAPVPVSPGDGDTVTTLTPTLTVNSATDPDGTPLTYFFEVSMSPDFSALTSSGEVIGESDQISWVVQNVLGKSMLYYWRARAFDGIGYSDYGPSLSFVVHNDSNTPPTAPNVQSPADESTVDTLLPTLVVINGSDEDDDPLTYEFELYSDADTLLASVANIAEGPVFTSWTVPLTLADSATYRWRARCFDSVDFSSWTPLTEFTVLLFHETNAPPSQPLHVSPANGDTVMVTPIVLLIENSLDPEGDSVLYDFWIYDDSTLNQIIETRFNVIETPGLTAAAFSFEPANGHKYWWCVRAKDSHNITDPTEPTWFIYAHVPTGDDDYTATPTGPENGVVVLTDRPILSTANIAAPGHNYYFFEVALESGFFSPVASSPPVPEGETGQTTWRVTQELQSGQIYYWRVRANDYAYSTVVSFTVDFRIYASPNPVRFRQGEHVTFHLPDDAVDLLIQTVSGETVLLEHGVSGDWAWYGANASGQNVATGIYLWYVPGTGSRGKILVKP